MIAIISNMNISLFEILSYTEKWKIVPFRTLNATSEKQYITLDRLLKSDGDFYDFKLEIALEKMWLYFFSPLGSKKDTTFKLFLLNSEMEFPNFLKNCIDSFLSNYINMTFPELWVPTWSFNTSNGAAMAVVMESIITR